jgi:hypothetical protein
MSKDHAPASIYGGGTNVIENLIAAIAESVKIWREMGAENNDALVDVGVDG